MASRLPVLKYEQGACQLLLPRRVAMPLSVCLLQGPTAEALGQIVSRSSTLAVWTICRAYQRSGRTMVTSEQAGSWLADHWWHLADIDDRLAKPVALTESSGPKEVPWQDEPRMQIGLLAARLAAQVQQPEDVCQRAAWLALVNGARGWIAAGTDGDVVDQLLPDSVLLLLDTLHDDQSTSDPVIRLAREMLQRAEHALAGDQGEDPEAHRAITDLADWFPGEQENQAPVMPFDLAQLARRIARMETMEENFDRQLEEEKLRALKELAQGAGHEINNPLANISIRAQTLLRNETDPERRVQLASINSQAFRATEMIADMMLFAKPPRMELQLVNVASLVHRAVDEISDRADQAGVAIRIEAEVGPLVVEADENHLVEAIKAVCVNSLEACRHGGLVEVMIHEQPTGGRDHDRAAVIEIRDDGPGIPAEIRPHIFSPFYSGREAGRGLGFGLSKSWRIVTEHGGRIEVDEPAEGARLMISLPLAEKRAA